MEINIHNININNKILKTQQWTNQTHIKHQINEYQTHRHKNKFQTQNITTKNTT